MQDTEQMIFRVIYDHWNRGEDPCPVFGYQRGDATCAGLRAERQDQSLEYIPALLVRTASQTLLALL